VTGSVTLRLFKGSLAVIGRESEHALYDERFVTFGEDDVYQQSDAAGFIRLFALPSRVRALKDQEMGLVASPKAIGAAVAEQMVDEPTLQIA
jgi:argininosuccinate synthase